MRIITKASYKDYYDRYSDPTDNQTVWVRTPMVADNQDPPIARLSWHAKSLHNGTFLTERDPEVIHRDLPYRYDTSPYTYYNNRSTDTGHFYPISLIFCGILYSAILYVQGPTSRPNYSPSRYRVYWSAEEYLKDFEVSGYKFYKDEFSQFFDPKPGYTEYCIGESSPVLLYAVEPGQYDFKWYKNTPSLGSLQFIKVMDPHTAFQELSMFVGGVMVKPDKTSVMTDKEKVASHGMDETSFRKGPTKVHR